MRLFFANSVQNKVEITKIKCAKGLKRTASILTIVPLLIMLMPMQVSAAVSSQGPRSPLAITSQNYVSYRGVWQSKPSAMTSNNSNTYATATSNYGQQPQYYTEWLIAKNFGFSVPENAVISGISVNVERRQSLTFDPSGFYDFQAVLVKNGALVGSSNIVSGARYYWPTTEETKTFGGSNQMWGQTLTPADINNGNFGFAILPKRDGIVSPGYYSSSATAMVDYMSMAVYYTLPDTEPPVIVAPPDRTIEATGPLTFVDLGQMTCSDNVDPAPVCGSNAPAGSLFPLGVTDVVWTATDSSGNSASDTQKITVQDTTAPQIPVQENITAEATSSAGAAVTFAPTATDATGTPVITCDPASGSTFALGTRIVTCTATDSSGNQSVATFNITVHDTTPPTISSVANITQEATSPSGAIVTFTNPTATDFVDGSVTVNCTPPSGSLFPLGPTTVNCPAMDSRGNSSATSFVVNVVDTTKPTVTSVDSDSDAYNLSTLSPHAIKVTFSEDISNFPYINVHSVPVGTQIVTDCSDADAKTFCFDYTIPTANEEAHTIYISDAQDVAGNTMIADNSHTFSVDTIVPTVTSITIDDNLINEADDGDMVTTTVNYSEAMDQTVNPTIGYLNIDQFDIFSGCSGSWFSATTFKYACTAIDNNVVSAPFPNSVGVEAYGAKDLAGNTQGSWGFYNLFNVDTIAPVITVDPHSTSWTNQDITVTAHTNEGSLNAASHTFTANGSFDFVATDLAGNSSTTTVTITNIDKTAPTIDGVQNDVNDDPTWWTTDFFNLILENVDFHVSGMASGQWQINGGTWQNIDWAVWPPGHTNAGETWGYMTITTEGENTVTVKLVDNAGNEFQHDYTVRLDKTAPVITLVGGNMSLTVGQTFSDPGASTDDGSAVITSGTVNTALVGTYQVRYNSTDSAGNVANEEVRTVYVNNYPVVNKPATGGIVSGDAYTEIFENGDFGTTDTNAPSEGTKVKGTDTQTNQGNNDPSTNTTAKSKGFNWNWVWYSLGALTLLGGSLWYALFYRKNKNIL